jgi:hypothetical protein
MAITFTQYLNNETNIKFAANCVLGFHVEDYVSDREYLYALDKGGQAYRADAPLGTHSFDNNQRTWYPVNTVPNAAKFIGNYPAPKKIAR